MRCVTTVGIVSPGAMGSAVGAAYARAGARVVATVAGRSERTQALAREAGLELLPDLDAVVAAADVLLSIVPPDRALPAAEEIAAAAAQAGVAPLVSDWNAVSPATARAIEAISRRGGPRAGRRLDLGRATARRLDDPRLPLGRPGSGACRGGAAGDRRARRRRRDRPRLGGQDVHGGHVQGLDRAARALAPDRAGATACCRRCSTTCTGRSPAQIDGAARFARGLGHEGRALRRRDARDRGDAGGAPA